MTVEIIPDVVPVIESTFGVVAITNGISEVESRVGVPIVEQELPTRPEHLSLVGLVLLDL
jgi:hypothetical protein